MALCAGVKVQSAFTSFWQMNNWGIHRTYSVSEYGCDCPCIVHEAFLEGSLPTDKMWCAPLLGWLLPSPNVLALPPHWLLTHSTYLTLSQPVSLCPSRPLELHTSQVSYHTPWTFQVWTFIVVKTSLSTFWHLSLFERWGCMCSPCWFPELSSYSSCSLTSTSTSFLFSSISSTATVTARCSITQNTVQKLYFKTYAEHVPLLCVKMWMLCA